MRTDATRLPTSSDCLNSVVYFDVFNNSLDLFFSLYRNIIYLKITGKTHWHKSQEPFWNILNYFYQILLFLIHYYIDVSVNRKKHTIFSPINLLYQDMSKPTDGNLQVHCNQHEWVVIILLNKHILLRYAYFRRTRICAC